MIAWAASVEHFQILSVLEPGEDYLIKISLTLRMVFIGRVSSVGRALVWRPKGQGFDSRVVQFLFGTKCFQIGLVVLLGHMDRGAVGMICYRAAAALAGGTWSLSRGRRCRRSGVGPVTGMRGKMGRPGGRRSFPAHDPSVIRGECTPQVVACAA
jgi:hypothetical protein